VGGDKRGGRSAGAPEDRSGSGLRALRL